MSCRVRSSAHGSCKHCEGCLSADITRGVNLSTDCGLRQRGFELNKLRLLTFAHRSELSANLDASGQGAFFSQNAATAGNTRSAKLSFPLSELRLLASKRLNRWQRKTCKDNSSCEPSSGCDPTHALKLRLHGPQERIVHSFSDMREPQSRRTTARGVAALNRASESCRDRMLLTPAGA